MDNQSLKNCTDTEIHELIDLALKEIRMSSKQCGDIIITLSDGKVKYIDVKKPLKLQ